MAKFKKDHLIRHKLSKHKLYKCIMADKDQALFARYYDSGNTIGLSPGESETDFEEMFLLSNWKNDTNEYLILNNYSVK